MIALITPGGAFLYDMTEKQADRYSEKDNFMGYESGKHLKGWIFHGNDLPGLIRMNGVYICYVDLNRMSDGEKHGYFKTTIDKLSDVWRQVFIKQ